MIIEAYNPKEIITDYEKLGDWCEVIHPQKEGKLCQQIIGELKATIREHDLEYLTAPQIGYNKRIFCIRFSKDDIRSYINPSIYNMAKITVARETCNSIPDKRFIIPRYDCVEFIYYKPLGKDPEATKVVGRTAHVVHHCVDHLDGLLTSDIGLEIDDMFDAATDEERAEVVKMYLETLDIRQKQLREEIDSDEDLKKMDDAINFMESVRKGETILDRVPMKNEDNNIEQMEKEVNGQP